ncbi:hypothetical protein SDC9_87915 [bioreactor metagenome]|uniref:Uncharacterized protein n=1 Tax=bioreactor metagenome TaxID=1076179 RepID=A0A644ZK46_9ZZZZ
MNEWQQIEPLHQAGVLKLIYHDGFVPASCTQIYKWYRFLAQHTADDAVEIGNRKNIVFGFVLLPESPYLAQQRNYRKSLRHHPAIGVI